MVVGLLSSLDQDAVVAQSETLVAGVAEGLQPAPLDGAVVVGHQQRALEVPLVASAGEVVSLGPGLLDPARPAGDQR